MVEQRKKKIVLIGGAPLVGKSTFAFSLSKSLDMPWVSTDDIRKWMQSLVREEDYPNLFDSVGIGAAEYYVKHNTPQLVLERSLAEGADVAKGITAMVDDFWWWQKFIVEGIAITPAYARELQRTHAQIDIEAIFFIDRDKSNIQERLDKRGLWDDAGTYPDHVKPQELQFTILYNDYFSQETTKYGFKSFDVYELQKAEQLFVTVAQ